MEEADSTFEEQRLFWEESEEVAEVLEKVARRLGFNGSEEGDNGTTKERGEGFLRPEKVDVMYDLCRYWRAFSPDKPSPWCAVFDKEDLKVTSVR